MLFNSWSFLLFFPIVTALYFAAPYGARWLLLRAASCVFYMAFVPAYIGILAVTILIDYVAGLRIAVNRGPRRRLWLVLSIASTLRSSTNTADDEPSLDGGAAIALLEVS